MIFSFYASKARQFRAHLRAGVTPDERTALAAWTTPPQAALFDSMHVADRRHGLDVVATLRAGGVAEPEVLVAGLLHDAGRATPVSGRAWSTRLARPMAPGSGASGGQ